MEAKQPATFSPLNMSNIFRMSAQGMILLVLMADVHTSQPFKVVTHVPTACTSRIAHCVDIIQSALRTSNGGVRLTTGILCKVLKLCKIYPEKVP